MVLSSPRADRVGMHAVAATRHEAGRALWPAWENIDFENRFLSVTNTLTRQDSAVVLRPPKGKRSRRIELADQDLVLLRNHRLRQENSCGSDWVFSDTEGNPLRRHNFLHRAWRKIVTDAEVAPLRFHDLRHTAATLCLAAGVPVKVVQERLGHASAKMTLDVYAKAVPSLQRTIAEKMSGILGDWDTFGDTSAGCEKKNVVK